MLKITKNHPFTTFILLMLTILFGLSCEKLEISYKPPVEVAFLAAENKANYFIRITNHSNTTLTNCKIDLVHQHMTKIIDSLKPQESFDLKGLQADLIDIKSGDPINVDCKGYIKPQIALMDL